MIDATKSCVRGASPAVWGAAADTRRCRMRHRWAADVAKRVSACGPRERDACGRGRPRHAGSRIRTCESVASVIYGVVVTAGVSVVVVAAVVAGSGGGGSVVAIVGSSGGAVVVAGTGTGVAGGAAGVAGSVVAAVVATVVVCVCVSVVVCGAAGASASEYWPRRQ